MAGDDNEKASLIAQDAQGSAENGLPVTGNESSKGSVRETPVVTASANEIKIASIGYMLAMGVCGTVLVALGSTLDKLAKTCGTTATDVGTVFIARGVGAILGALLSAKLYLWFRGNVVMGAALVFITGTLFVMPFNTSVDLLHINFLLLGLATAVTDTGCQIMTRKVHGKKAGPWLGANTVAFGVSGAFVPLVEIFTENIFWQYYTIAAIVGVVAITVIFGPNPEKHGRIANGPPPPRAGGGSGVPHYRVEFVIAFMVFCFIGGKVSATAYLSTYVSDTGIMSEKKGATLMLILWVAITVGRLAGVQDQRFLTNKTLPVHLSLLCIGGFVSMLLVLWFPDNTDTLWIGIAFYGLFNGPCVGYCYDLNNRITYPSEKSMSIVMFGLNFGASLVPFLTTVIWNHGGGPLTLIVVIYLSMFLPLPFLHITKYLSYDPTVNPRIKHQYESLATEDEAPM